MIDDEMTDSCMACLMCERLCNTERRKIWFVRKWFLSSPRAQPGQQGSMDVRASGVEASTWQTRAVRAVR